MGATNSEFDVTTDIYRIVESVDNIKKRYIDDENETTLSLGIFGFLTDTEAKKIQTSILMTGELGNEMFATRAKLTKNVLTHAAYSSIQNINATPAEMIMTIGIRLRDLDSYFKEDQFIIDCTDGIFVGTYEFHLDYDVVITRAKKNKTSDSIDSWSYTAQYRMSEEDGTEITNPISSITNQYIMQPFVSKLDNYWYLLFQAKVHQYTVETTFDRIISDSVLANKTFMFDYDNQLADFDVFVTHEGVTTKLRPYLYGSDVQKEEMYCWYLFLDDNTVRISFDSMVFTPGLNDQIKIVAYTTLGYDGNFEYIKVDRSSEGFYFEMSSTKYGYNNLTCFGLAVTDSVYGTNRKTKQELQRLLPKASMARGSLTTETDVNNYFNMIDDENNRLKMQKKVDNQLTRIWYAYFLLKDQMGNMIPTNTIKIHLDLNSPYWSKSPDGRIIIPAGTGIIYNKDTKIGELIDIGAIPNPIDNDDFYGDDYYYVTVYSMVLTRDPLYASFYSMCVNTSTFFTFRWINVDALTQFVANRVFYRRNLLTDQYQYHIEFSIAQSMVIDYGLYNIEYDQVIKEDPETGEEYYETVKNETLNLKVILVLYNKNNAPYRWKECTFDADSYKNDGTFTYKFTTDLLSDNGLDNDNNIRLLDLYVAGSRDKNYGYFDPSTRARIYILAKFDSELHDSTERGYGEDCLDNIAPGYEEYIVANIYDLQDKLTLLENYTDLIDSKVDSLDEEGLNYNLSGVPVVGGQYINIDFDEVEDNATYFYDALSDKRSYIDYCLELLEHTMDVDYKLFNTYGPSATYITEEGDPINHIDLTLKFALSLKFSSDITTKDKIVDFIKEYIEDLYEDRDDLHIPNLITAITNEFNRYINYIEFIGFNGFDPSVQHILLQEPDDPTIVPEFLNIRNTFIGDAKNLQPCIQIEIV